MLFFVFVLESIVLVSYVVYAVKYFLYIGKTSPFAPFHYRCPFLQSYLCIKVTACVFLQCLFCEYSQRFFLLLS